MLEYGQYALIGEIAHDVLTSLERHFPADRVCRIFAYASILYANGFVRQEQVHSYYEKGWLSQEYKTIPFKMGKTALGSLLDDLGRRTTRVVRYEEETIRESSSAIAIDGHAIRSCFDENGLGESGYKFLQLKGEQVNLLVGYDIHTSMPLFARMFRGYKKRWGIETLYQYLKNKGDYNDLMIQDYYKEQGFAFIMLVTGQIHQRMLAAVKSLNDSTMSVHDVLLMARCLKMERRGNNWNLKNVRKRELQILERMGFRPKLMVSDI